MKLSKNIVHFHNFLILEHSLVFCLLKIAINLLTVNEDIVNKFESLNSQKHQHCTYNSHP